MNNANWILILVIVVLILAALAGMLVPTIGR